MAIGDLDGDDDLDLVTPIVGAVSVLLNRGDATFEPFVAYPTRRGYPWAVVIADLNGDLIPDLAVANSDGGPDGDLSILLGNGDGTFQDAVVYDMHYHPASGAWIRPVSLAAYDLDDDKDLDLVVGFSSWGEDKILVLLNPGDGSFAHYDVYATEELPIAVAVGRLNGDAHADIVVAAVRTIVLLGNGDGSFMAEQDIPQTYGLRGETWHNTTSLAAGDLNSDGYPDLALTNRIAENGGPSNVVVFLNGGDGTFQEPSTHIVGRPEEENTQSLVVRMGDLDGNGDLDLAVMSQGSPRGDCQEPTGSLAVLFNRGDGSFDAPTILWMNTCPWNFALADLDGDRDLDIATVHGTLVHVVGLQLNNGDGTFSEEVLIPTEYGARYLAVGDIDGDGDADLVIPLRDSRSGGERQLAIFFNGGDATFPDPTVYPLPDFPSPENIILVDLDADGDLDVAIANCRQPAQNGPDDHNFSVMFNDGRGNLGQRVDYIVPGTDQSRDLEAGNLDGDGHMDLAVANFHTNNISVPLNDGHGRFASGVPYGVGEWPGELVIADFDGDGELDVAVASLGSDNLTVLWNRACRRLPGDLDGDGVIDLDDYAFFHGCLTGPRGGVEEGCALADIERDDDVDARDYSILLPAWNQP
jgi:hypothetical protein